MQLLTVQIMVKVPVRNMVVGPKRTAKNSAIFVEQEKDVRFCCKFSICFQAEGSCELTPFVINVHGNKNFSSETNELN